MPKKKVIKNKTKKPARGKEKMKKIKIKKKTQPRRPKLMKKAAAAEEKFQDLREAVARLPEIKLPGAPVDIPKDLPEENPSFEPPIIPKQEFSLTPSVVKGYADISKEYLKHKPYETLPNNNRAKQAVWLAVAATFSVIAAVWVGTLKTSLAIPASETGLNADLQSFKNELDEAASGIKEALRGVTVRLNQEEPPALPSQEVVQAVGARVIFEAAQNASGTEITELESKE